MTQKRKRLLSLVLTLAMVLSLMSTGAWAAEPEDNPTQPETVTEAVDPTGQEEPTEPEESTQSEETTEQATEADDPTEAEEETEAEDPTEAEDTTEAPAAAEELPVLEAEESVTEAAAMALAPVPYLKWDSAQKKLVNQTGDNACQTYTEVSDQTTWGAEATETWYVVNKPSADNLTISERITVKGTVNLILCDGAKLTASAGITTTGATLNIYAQSVGDSAGSLAASGASQDAGIGGLDGDNCGNPDGGTLNIHGGKIEAYGDQYAAGIGGGDEGGAGGTITIYGGTITATGGFFWGAGIGGGYKGAGGSITIYGGTMTATGGGAGAGIGGGFKGDGGTITIYGGTMTATGGFEGAGIGGGDGGDGGSITIYGGTMTATGGGEGAGIGGGYNGDGGTITIYGGTMTATGGFAGAGIGGGYCGAGGSITIHGGTVKAIGGEANSDYYGGAGIGGGGKGAGGTVAINGGDVTAIGGGTSDETKNVPAVAIGPGEWKISDIQSQADDSYKGTVTLGALVGVMAGDDENSATDVTATYAQSHDQLWAHLVTGGHEHDFTYTAKGDTITAACGDGCDITEGLTLTVSAPKSLTYDGQPKEATLSTGYNPTAFPGSYSITYTKQGDPGFTGTPTDAGTYTASVTVGEATATVSFTIAPKQVGLTWANTKFTYDGKSHAPTATATGLVGSDTCTVTVTGGKTNAGTYTATATKLSNANYKLPAKATRSFTIAKAAQKAPAAPVVTKTTGTGITVKTAKGLEYRVSGGGKWQSSGSFTGLKVGTTYTVYARKAADANHNASPASSTKARTLNAAILLQSGTKISASGKTITAKWGKVPGATAYDIYVQYCGEEFEDNATTTVKGTSVTIEKIAGKAIDTGKNYKLYIVARSGKTVLGKTTDLHGVASGRQGKLSDPAEISVNKTALTLNKGKSAKLGATVKPERGQLDSSHGAALRYVTSDSSVASVDKTGKVTAKGAGVCTIQVIVFNGLSKSVTVTVSGRGERFFL